MAPRSKTNKYTYEKNSNDEYFCPTCKFTTPNQNTMHYHYKTHQEQKPHKCEDCGKSFTVKQTLENHILAKHTKEKEKQLYECTKCNFTNLTKGNCRIHYMRMHYKKTIEKILEQDEDGYHCKQCNNTFKGATSYYYHAFDCLGLGDKKYCELITS